MRNARSGSLVFAALLALCALIGANGASAGQSVGDYHYTVWKSLTSDPQPTTWQKNIPKPPGATTQYLRFKFYSSGYFTKAPLGHFAVALRGDATPTYLDGRGIALGHTHLIDPPSPPNFGGCRQYSPLPGPGTAQLESFFGSSGGNFVYESTCRPLAVGPGLQDYTWYTFEIHVNDGNWMAFWINDQYGNRIDAGYEPAIQDANPVPAGLTKIWLLAAEWPSSGTGWSVKFQDMEYGWF